MRPFAKLFGPDNDQLLVMRQQCDRTGCPQVIVYFQPQDPDLDTCSKAATFSNSDAGELQANLVFSHMTEEAARRFIADTVAATSNSRLLARAENASYDPSKPVPVTPNKPESFA